MSDLQNEKIINKIQKLFARKQSNYAAEAETALLVAQKLMIQHGLTMQDIGQLPSEECKVAEQSAYHSQTPMWHGKIANILAKNFRCKSIWLWKNRNGNTVRVMTFIGYPEDAAIVKEAYLYAIALVNFNIRCIKKRYPRVTRGYLNTYIDGFIVGLKTKFDEQVNKEEWGLVLVTPVPVQTQYDAYNPVTINPKGRPPEKSNNQKAFNQGYIDGKNFEHDRKRIQSKVPKPEKPKQEQMQMF